MLHAMRWLFCVSLLVASPWLALAVEGVSGSTIRPTPDEAQVKGCHISKPGEYDVNVGDLIDLEYSYPVVPTAMPKKVAFTATSTGAVTASPLGTRTVYAPPLVGMTTIAFYFDAKKQGDETISLSIDGQEYTYKFKVGAKK